MYCIGIKYCKVGSAFFHAREKFVSREPFHPLCFVGLLFRSFVWDGYAVLGVIRDLHGTFTMYMCLGHAAYFSLFLDRPALLPLALPHSDRLEGIWGETGDRDWLKLWWDARISDPIGSWLLDGKSPSMSDRWIIFPLTLCSSCPLYRVLNA